jgi:drug/metabolite transporter (DMT)-like permease
LADPRDAHGPHSIVASTRTAGAAVARSGALAALPVWVEAALCMAVAAVGFAIMGACAKAASRSLPFLEVAFVRAAVGAVLVVAYARARGLSLRVGNRRVMALRAVSGTIAMGLTFFALSTAPLGEASALLNLTPLFVAAIGAVWLRERVEPLVGACLLLGLGGAALVFAPSLRGGLGSLGSGHPGSLAAVAAAATSALAMTSLRRLGSSETPEAVVAWFLGIGAIALGLLAAPSMRYPSPRDALLMLIAGASSTIAQVAMTRAYSMDVAARVGGMNYLNIVASLLLGVVVFGERPGLAALAGIGAILAAGALLVWSSRQRARLDATRGPPPHHPQVSPLFCSFSHSASGAKYSSIAVASACVSPLSVASASGQGLLAPSLSIAVSFAPAALFP